MSAKSSSGRRPRRGAGLRPLREQIAVVTGGSSGIGRETALRFAKEGATVVILSRDDAGLAKTVDEITRSGGRARHIVCDVTDQTAVQSAVDLVEQWYGRLDTWVGNAGVLMYARFLDTAPDEFRSVMEANFLSQVHGIRAAVPALRRAGGGALVCVTSTEGVVTLPMHSAYAASKHALEGALDGLRRELIADRAPISVTAVRPAVIDTPLYGHARNRMHRRPSGPPPYYDPAVVAEAIVFAAAHPVRVVHAGGGGWLLSIADRVMPGVLDAVFGRFGIRMMHTGDPAPYNPGNLEQSIGGGGESRGGLPRRGRRWSILTWLAVHPRTRRGLMLSSAIAALSRRQR